MPSIQWEACDPSTGEVIEVLPGVCLESSLPNYVGRGDKVSLSMPAVKRPTRWQLATEPNRVVLVARYDDADQTVLWAGPASSMQCGSAALIKFSAVSVDDWLDQQYTGTVFDGPYSVIDRDRALILADMLAPIAAEFNGTINVTPCGTSQSLTVTDAEDKTCADVVKTMMQLGLEYKVEWGWDHGALKSVITVGPRIGAYRGQVLLSNIEWELTKDASKGKGATIVTTTATNSGKIRNQATAKATELLAAGYLPTEHRYSPDSGTQSTDFLAENAAAKLSQIKTGTSSLSMTFHPDSPYLIGRDLQLGDSFEVDLANPDIPEIAQSRTVRMVGWVAEASKKTGQIVKITPVLDGEE